MFKNKVMLRALLFGLSLLPLFAYVVNLLRGEFTDPIEAGLNQSGFAALTLLLCSLTCSPLKRIFGWNWPLQNRKMLGLFSFFYALLHFLTYVAIDQTFDWASILEDITKRPFIAVGFTAFVLLIPLALTSTKRSVRALGFAQWQLLHRLVYCIGILGVIHFFWRVKKDVTEPAIFAGLLAVLLLERVIASLRRPRRA